MATTTINTNAMGIVEFEAAINASDMTVHEVICILDARIAKRQATNKPLISKVVAYRNKLVDSYNVATGNDLPVVNVPSYAKAQPNASLPADPNSLADVVFATVGAAGIGQVISRLTARLIA
jgi:hypothetical protein